MWTSLTLLTDNSYSYETEFIFVKFLRSDLQKDLIYVVGAAYSAKRSFRSALTLLSLSFNLIFIKFWVSLAHLIDQRNLSYQYHYCYGFGGYFYTMISSLSLFDFEWLLA